MSTWNAVLKSLHSSLIDELNEKYPDEKPELGLPVRFSAWKLPHSSEKSVVCEVSLDHSHGLVAIGAMEKQSDLDLTKLMTAIISRSKRDFERHGIDPQFGSPTRADAITSCLMLIWLPISLTLKTEKLVFDLGVGIR